MRDVAPGLASYLGTVTNYKTGEAYEWTQQDLDDLRALELSDQEFEGLSGHVRAYLDADDEVLPAPQIAEFLKARGIATRLFAGGNHQFQHMDELFADLAAARQAAGR